MKKTTLQNLTLVLLIAVVSSVAISLGSEGVPPIADAGLPRYAAQDPVVLDGTGSYDPDESGPLSYTWRQISGSTVVIGDTDTAIRLLLLIQSRCPTAGLSIWELAEEHRRRASPYEYDHRIFCFSDMIDDVQNYGRAITP